MRSCQHLDKSTSTLLTLGLTYQFIQFDVFYDWELKFAGTQWASLSSQLNVCLNSDFYLLHTILIYDGRTRKLIYLRCGCIVLLRRRCWLIFAGDSHTIVEVCDRHAIFWDVKIFKWINYWALVEAINGELLTWSANMIWIHRFLLIKELKQTVQLG